MTEVPELSTERLPVRRRREEDLEQYAATARDPLVAEWLGEPEPPKPADVWRDIVFHAGPDPPDKPRSIRVAEKLGEAVEGHFQLREFDLHVYGADLPLSGSPG